MRHNAAGPGQFYFEESGDTMRQLNKCHTKLRDLLDPDKVLWPRSDLPAWMKNIGGGPEVAPEQLQQQRQAMLEALLACIPLCESVVQAAFTDICDIDNYTCMVRIWHAHAVRSSTWAEHWWRQHCKQHQSSLEPCVRHLE
jgi:hypothetical protein